jgi:hypothetical protein
LLAAHRSRSRDTQSSGARAAARRARRPRHARAATRCCPRTDTRRRRRHSERSRSFRTCSGALSTLQHIRGEGLALLPVLTSCAAVLIIANWHCVAWLRLASWPRARREPFTASRQTQACASSTTEFPAERYFEIVYPARGQELSQLRAVLRQSGSFRLRSNIYCMCMSFISAQAPGC